MMSTQNILQYLLAIAVLASIIVCTVSVTTQTYYVKPNDNTTCPARPCQSLSYYIQNLAFDSYTTFYFLGGTHVLEQEDLVIILMKTNLSLVGESTSIPPVSGLAEYEPPSKILCTRRGGFAFLFTSNIVISNLAFINCGADLPLPAKVSFKSTLSFHATTGLNIYGTVVQNSSGYGMILSKPLENSVISHSVFFHNTGSEEYVGGNILVSTLAISESEKVNCSKDGSRDWILIIDSSLIAYGSNVHNSITPAGLIFNIDYWPCIGSQIIVNNAILIENSSPKAVAGGNLVMEVRENADNTYSEKNRENVSNSVISISNCNIGEGEAELGGGMYLSVTPFPAVCSILKGDNNTHRLVNISNTTFVSNTASQRGGGLFIQLVELCTRYEIRLSGVNFTGNKVLDDHWNQTVLAGDVTTGVGGNVAIYPYGTTSVAPLHSIILENCMICHGWANVGAGIAIFTMTGLNVADSYSYDTGNVSHNLVRITNTYITDNNGSVGGGVSIIAVGVTENSQSFINSIHIQNSMFKDNTGYAGSAMFVLTNGILPYSTQNQFLMENVSFQHNQHSAVDSVDHILYIDKNASATVVLQGVQNATFVDCNFSNNNGTGNLAIQSYMFFQGDVVFQNNTGKNGGGLSLFGSFMIPKPHTRILFLNNHAQQAGGGIHIEWERSPLYSIYCFLQPDFGVLHNNTLADMDVQIVFENNTAGYAGTALYGGYIDQCLMINSAYYGNTSRFIYLTTMVGYSKEVFNAVFDLDNDTQLSVISSDPLGVCICKQGVPRCDQKIDQNSNVSWWYIHSLSCCCWSERGSCSRNSPCHSLCRLSLTFPLLR